MSINNLKKRVVVSIFISPVFLVISYMMSFNNLTELLDSNEGFFRVVGFFGYMILPYSIVAIAVQGFILFLILFNIKNNKTFNIVNFIIQVVYFVAEKIFLIPFIVLNWMALNKILGCIIAFSYEILNVYILVLMAEIISVSSKERSESNE